VKIVDEFPGSIPKVVPSSPRRGVPSTDPLHRDITSGIGEPFGRAVTSLQQLVKDHFQQHDRVVCQFSDTAIDPVDRTSRQLIDLTFDDPSMVIRLKLLIDFDPLGIVRRKRAQSIAFLIVDKSATI
jgi:hypothetical protein